MENNNFEMENQFILRMPSYKDGRLHPAVNALREALKSDELKDRLFIDLDIETRKGTVMFDNEKFKARLVDLPCVIESLKTQDKKTLYKVADICQMLICKANDDEPNPLFDSDLETDASSKNRPNSVNNNNNNTSIQEINKKYLWLHGITPPLKNARKKRFRKVAKKKIVDYAEIEAEVKRLFKADRDAVKVDYEVIYVDEPNPQTGNDDDDEQPVTSKKSMMDSLNMADESLSSFNTATNKMHDHDDMNTLDLHTDESNDALLSRHDKPTSLSSKYAKTSSYDFLIGDVSSSSDSDDMETQSLMKIRKDNKKKLDKQKTFDLIDAVADDESTNFDSPRIVSNRQSIINDINDDTTNTNLGDDQNSNMGLNDDNFDSSSLLGTFDINKANMDKLNRLMDELDEIRIRRRKQEDEINQISHPVLRNRFLPTLNDLIEEEKNKNNEIENLKSLINE